MISYVTWSDGHMNSCPMFMISIIWFYISWLWDMILWDNFMYNEIMIWFDEMSIWCAVGFYMDKKKINICYMKYGSVSSFWSKLEENSSSPVDLDHRSKLQENSPLNPQWTCILSTTGEFPHGLDRIRTHDTSPENSIL